MSVSIATMWALDSQIKVLDKAIEQQFEIIPNTLTSIPGIGKVYSAGIIAEIGKKRSFLSVLFGVLSRGKSHRGSGGAEPPKTKGQILFSFASILTEINF